MLQLQLPVKTKYLLRRTAGLLPRHQTKYKHHSAPRYRYPLYTDILSERSVHAKMEGYAAVEPNQGMPTGSPTAQAFSAAVTGWASAVRTRAHDGPGNQIYTPTFTRHIVSYDYHAPHPAVVRGRAPPGSILSGFGRGPEATCYRLLR